jgi:tetratricopeptide (TPR) repeat protein
MLELPSRRLLGWERQGFVPRLDTYTFQDLVSIRSLIRLREARVPAARVRRAIAALRGKLAAGENPLAEVRIYADGPRIHVQLGRETMEPVTGQLLLDFDGGELQRLVAFPPESEASRRARDRERRKQADLWFQRGVELERSGGPAENAIEAYRKSIELDPKMGAALVNLGTIYFAAKDFDEAERCYRRAIETNPEYALAHFNLGNLHDERNDSARALFHYLAALRLDPNYADAHYNVALLYQGAGQWMKAVRHWKHYLRLDPASEWSAIARRELAKIYDATVVEGKRGPRRAARG